MSTPRFDVTGLGNAIVDVLARTDDDTLIKLDIRKAGMTLIDEERAEFLYSKMGGTLEMSGGSAANTIVGTGLLGMKTAFMGKVRNDHLGGVFGHDIRASNVHFATTPASDGPTTARCLIFVTPDGERTMSTYLGAAQGLSPEDIDPEVIAASHVTYLEGYLWDPPAAKEAFLKAATIAHGAKRHVALTLSDGFCVDRYRDEFLQLIRENIVDIVFANEDELHSLYQTGDFATAVDAFRKDIKLGIITRSEKGAMAVEGASTFEVPSVPVDRVVDTTGAGDLFAAGFLSGFCKSFNHKASLGLGALCAAEIISHMGARPEANIRALAQERGFRV